MKVYYIIAHVQWPFSYSSTWNWGICIVLRCYFPPLNIELLAFIPLELVNKGYLWMARGTTQTVTGSSCSGPACSAPVIHLVTPFPGVCTILCFKIDNKQDYHGRYLCDSFIWSVNQLREHCSENRVDDPVSCLYLPLSRWEQCSDPSRDTVLINSKQFS